MLIGHFTEQPWQDENSGLMGTQSVDLGISNSHYRPEVGAECGRRLRLFARSGIAGPVLLKDDMVDSRWTFTIAAPLLREQGCAAVFPFALANTGSG